MKFSGPRTVVYTTNEGKMIVRTPLNKSQKEESISEAQESGVSYLGSDRMTNCILVGFKNGDYTVLSNKTL